MFDVYNQTFYGKYYHCGTRFSRVIICRDLRDVPETKYEELRIEIRLLKTFQDEKNVLEINFVDVPHDGPSYETLFGPSMYYDDGRWQKTSYRNTALAFIKMCEKEKISLEKITSKEELLCQKTFQ